MQPDGGHDFGERKRGKKRARFNQEKGRGNKRELRALCKRKIRMALRVRQEIIRNRGKRHIIDVHSAFLNKREERLKRPLKTFLFYGKSGHVISIRYYGESIKKRAYKKWRTTLAVRHAPVSPLLLGQFLCVVFDGHA